MDSNVNVGEGSRGATDGNPSETVLQDFTELLKPGAEELRATGGLTSQPEMPMESPCLNMGLGLTSKKDEETPDSNGGLKYSPVSYRSRHRNTFSRRNETPPRPETNDLRIARPPGEGRGRNQLLPRYWPRITEREIQQITPGDSNSVITPLFEKVLSASDAGRIGRLVLPKACAEAYFPQISQPEGLPLRINDMNGREWQFQFRFWPNNNSRMYVLEGVTPCIQAMQLQAGDTVTFSRLEPEGKLIMGFRRSSALQESVGDDVASLNGKYQSGSDYKGAKSREAQSLLSDKRRGRPLGAKSKRLRLETEESLEIKSSWEEAQELLRPPPGVTPSFVTIDGHQFEEYEEPPVLAKKTLTRTKPSGEQERWVQCDACTQYRRVPFEVFLHTLWTCADNVWDPKRAHCSAPRELTNEDIDQLLSLNNRTVPSVKQEDRPGKVDESSGLDALASAAAIGNDAPGSPPPPAATTRHPRHRPGCTCIVCIQPPSGKGPKHKPSCVCNVCLTVKRRFKTLMMRRKKRQSEREAENAARKKSKSGEKEEPSAAAELSSSSSKWGSYQADAGSARQERSSRKTFPFPPAPGLLSTPFQLAVEGQQQHPQMPIDLNCHPDREEGTRISMLRLLQDASLPLDLYMKQQGLASLQQRQQRRDQEQQREQQQQQQHMVDQQQEQTDKQIQPNVSSA